MPPIHHQTLPARGMQRQNHSHLSGGKVCQPGVLQAVRPKLVPSLLPGQLHRLGPAACLALQIIHCQQLRQLESLPKPQFTRLENIHGLPHPPLCQRGVKPPVLDDVRDIKADAIKRAQARGRLQDSNKLVPERRILLRVLVLEHENLAETASVVHRGGSDALLQWVQPLRLYVKRHHRAQAGV